MTRLSARSFGGNSPATGEPAELAIFGDRLAVMTPAGTEQVPIASLRLRPVGLRESGLELSWDAAGGVRAVQVDAAGVSVLRADPAFAACSQMAALQARKRRVSFGRGLGWTLVAIFVLFPLLVIGLFIWQADRIAAAAARRIPVEQEVLFGQQAFESMRGQLKLVESGPDYEAVQRLGTRLTRDSRYTYNFHVAEDDAVNAFALPGGIIVVHTGLIDATRTPEELAGVLAHEVQHVEQRHSLEALVKDLGLRGLWLLLAGDIGGGLLGQAAVEITSLSFSRGAEEEADAEGFDTLVASGIDPQGMADFFMVLKQEQGAAPPPFLSTHPRSEDRAEALRARLAEVSGRQFEELDFGPWPP
jgi:Zn-dependent protease with chaperone function